MNEQAGAAQEVTGQMEALASGIAQVASAMDEQSTALTQVSSATENIRRQTEQTARGVVEQARAAAEIREATRNVTHQITLVTRANVTQTSGLNTVVGQIEEAGRKWADFQREARQAADRTAALAEQARRLSATSDSV